MSVGNAIPKEKKLSIPRLSICTGRFVKYISNMNHLIDFSKLSERKFEA